mmetsp:Transcript_108196/g.316422  ORF Transcript_108196/g.316422 Transcript_108196/m.316422 type:complete len:236 (-) Transcript_108196:31-738(-)
MSKRQPPKPNSARSQLRKSTTSLRTCSLLWSTSGAGQKFSPVSLDPHVHGEPHIRSFPSQVLSPLTTAVESQSGLTKVRNLPLHVAFLAPVRWFSTTSQMGLTPRPCSAWVKARKSRSFTTEYHSPGKYPSGSADWLGGGVQTWLKPASANSAARGANCRKSFSRSARLGQSKACRPATSVTAGAGEGGAGLPQPRRHTATTRTVAPSAVASMAAGPYRRSQGGGCHDTAAIAPE